MSQILMERPMTLPVEDVELETTDAVTLMEAQPRAAREHLTLVEWRGATLPVRLTDAPASRPLRRRSLGWFDSAVILLMLSSAWAGAYALLHLG